MNIYCMVAKNRKQLQDLGPLPDDLIDELLLLGHKVDVGFADDFLLPTCDIKNQYDLYLMKAHDDLWLSVAAILHSDGAWMVNSYPSSIAAENKIVAAHRLETSGIPVPKTWITTNLNNLRRQVAVHPVLIKPHIGGMGRSSLIKRIDNERDLASVIPPCETYIIQAYVPGPVEDLKVYVIGDAVFSLRKKFAPRNFSQPGKLCHLTSEVKSIAQKCRHAFGLDLFGLDIIESESGPVVVDINYFPSYNGVPDAGTLLAAYIDQLV